MIQPYICELFQRRSESIINTTLRSVSDETFVTSKQILVFYQHSSAFIFGRIFFIFVGNEDKSNISEVFEIRPDRTKDCGVSCP